MCHHRRPKPKFPFETECRTLNPGKNQLGLLSKVILERIVNEIRRKSELTQWKNSYEVLEWFKNIDNIKNKCFVNFDIINFYPSISHEHLSEAITFAKNFTEIKNEDIQLIEHTCKTIVTYDNRTWVKKDSNSQFDVPMGSFFGAELCDLVGLYALSKLRHLYNYKAADSIGMMVSQ